MAPAGCASGAGQVCQGTDVETCAVDQNGCVFVSARKTCLSADACGGTFPDADCVCPAAPAACGGQVGTFCDQGGSVVVTCALDADGCVVKTAQVTCPTVACSGVAGVAKCGSCPTPPSECQTAGTLCPSTTQVETCGLDTNGCLAKLAVTTCATGTTCVGAAPTGACVCPALPNWWTGSSPYNDPLWSGSYQYGSGSVIFNALTETDSQGQALLLRWHVTGDSGVASDGDQVWVGFYDPTTTVATVLLLTRDAATNTTAGMVGAGVMSATAYTRTGTSGAWSSATFPGTVSTEARLDVFCDTSTFPVSCSEWIIRLRVPTTSAAGGIVIPNPFDLWFEVDVDHGGSAPVDHVTFPAGAADVPGTFPVTPPPPLGATTPVSAPWSSVGIGGGACASGFGPN